jgi:hypothetical protein
MRSEGERIDSPVFLFYFHAINRNDIDDRNQKVVFVVNIQSMNGPNVARSSQIRKS